MSDGTETTAAMCEHGIATEAVRVGMDGRERSGFTHWLCGWGDSAAGVAALTGAPRWMQRNVLAGHLMGSGDCAGCPAFRAKEAAMRPPG